MSGSPSRAPGLRTSGVLLVAAVATWFAPLVFMAATTLREVGPRFTTTPWLEFVPMLRPYRAEWVVWQLLDVLSFALAAAGVYGIRAALRGTRGGALARAGLLAAIGALGVWCIRRYIDLGLTDVDRLPPLVADNEQLRGPLQFGAIVLLSAAVACIGLALFRSGRLRGPGLVVGLLAAVLVVADTVIAVRQSFAYAVGVPSLAPLVLLMALGLGLLVRRPHTKRPGPAHRPEPALGG